jgi:hypothetical protein
MKILYYELEPTDPVVPKLQLLSVQLRMQQLSFMTKAMQVTSKVEIQPSSAKIFLTNIVPCTHSLVSCLSDSSISS